MTIYIQKAKPNFNVTGNTDMCLKYVDDALNASSRSSTAHNSYKREKANKQIRSWKDIPNDGQWVVVFWNYYKGITNYGHVAFYNRKLDQVYSSNTAKMNGGKPWTLAKEESLIGGSKNRLGFSLWVDGIEVTKEHVGWHKMDLPRHGATIRKEFEIAGIKGNRCAEIKDYNPHTVLLNWNGKDWI